jgi:hypothetical protein
LCFFLAFCKLIPTHGGKRKKRQKFGFANTEKTNRKLRGEQQEIDNRNFELQFFSIFLFLCDV